MARHIQMQVPVLITDDYQHIMAEVHLVEDEQEGAVHLTLDVKGAIALDLVALMTSGEPVALKFVDIPVIKHDRKI